jgi:ribosome-associated toxin RatA of RatAB toxin-antitoxin module
VYRVVADVEQYPVFLSDVSRVERSGDEVSMTLRLGPVPVTLVTRARFTPGVSIELTQLRGPFRRFDARWTFAGDGEATAVGYHADYELPWWSPLLAGPAGLMIEMQTQRQIRAFEARVRALLDSPAAAG